MPFKNSTSTIQALEEYIKECHKKIDDSFLTNNEMNEGISIRQELIKLGKINDHSTIDEAIKKHRHMMIDIKLSHTMRVVEKVTKLSRKIGLDLSYIKLLRIAALLHDIGRFDQATWNSSFNDSCYEKKDIYGIKNHSEAGYHILFVNNRIKDMNVPFNFRYAVGEVVKNHQVTNLSPELSYQLNPSIAKLNVLQVLTGHIVLSYEEKVIISTIVQMIRDIDMLDILYQHLTGDYPLVIESINYKTSGESLKTISNYWGISEETLKTYNNITSDDISSLSKILIPISSINPSKLEVPSDIKDFYFANKPIDLHWIINRRDWTFIIGMWWRLNKFLNEITFTSNLEIIMESELLDKIYELYPDIYKPFVKEAFDFAKEEILKKKIEENKGKIYINKMK